LTISLLLLGLPFIAARVLPPASEDEERPEHDDHRTSHEAAEIEAAEAEAAETEAAEAEATEVEAVEAFEAEAAEAEAATIEAAQTESAEIHAAKIEAERQAEDAPTEEPAPSFDEDVHALQPDPDHGVDEPEAPEGDVSSQELMRQLREAIKARAEQAGRRAKKKSKDDFQEAASGPKSAQ
jgi:hypothetical protein